VTQRHALVTVVTMIDLKKEDLSYMM
jgi:hypothetical protein